MIRFAILDSLLLCLKNSVECLLRGSLSACLPLHARAVLFSNRESVNKITPLLDAQGFHWHVSRIRGLLGTCEASSPDVQAALKDLRAFSPTPSAEVIEPDPWGWRRPCLVVKSHLRPTFTDAVVNIKSTGRTLSPDDEKYLQLILTHNCGWSATYPEHLNDNWVGFFRKGYPHLVGMIPILDSLTYVDELELLPEGMKPIRPTLFLLATAESYYVYDFSDEGYGLSRAGETLEEVFIGLKEYKHLSLQEEIYEQCIDEVDESDYFPIYYRNEDGRFGRRGSDMVYNDCKGS